MISESVDAVSPFDDLIMKIRGETFSNPSNIDLKKQFIANQLHLLRVIYLQMPKGPTLNPTEIKRSTRELSMRESIFGLSDDSIKVKEEYFSFLSILNQFNRVLREQYHEPNLIPLGTRINFFRNKAIEHWDMYSKNIPGNFGHTWVSGKIRIPFVGSIYPHDELKTQQIKLKNKFTVMGIAYDIDCDGAMLANQPEITEKMYKALETINPNLIKIPKPIIHLLFDIGFPMPILSIEDYSKQLSQTITQKIK